MQRDEKLFNECECVSASNIKPTDADGDDGDDDGSGNSDGRTRMQHGFLLLLNE